MVMKIGLMSVWSFLGHLEGMTVVQVPVRLAWTTKSFEDVLEDRVRRRCRLPVQPRSAQKAQ